GIGALRVWLLSEDPGAPHPRRATAAIAAEPSKDDSAVGEPAPERKRAPEETREQKKIFPRPATTQKVEPPPRKVGSGKLYGTLTVNPQGGALITFSGTAQPRQVGPYIPPGNGPRGPAR